MMIMQFIAAQEEAAQTLWASAVVFTGIFLVITAVSLPSSMLTGA